MQTEQIQEIALDRITPHPGNRRVGGFDEVKLQQLADSIRAVGVQQPAVVRPHPDRAVDPSKEYELVAGERRLRASRIAGRETLPCVIRELDDLTVLRVQTIENLQGFASDSTGTVKVALGQLMHVKQDLERLGGTLAGVKPAEFKRGEMAGWGKGGTGRHLNKGGEAKGA